MSVFEGWLEKWAIFKAGERVQQSADIKKTAEVQDAEQKAASRGPATVDDAIRRMRDGTA